MRYIYTYIHKTYYYKENSIAMFKEKLSSLSIDLQEIHTKRRTTTECILNTNTTFSTL